MAQPNYGTAALQTSLMLQKVNKDVKLSENLDSVLDSMFSDITEDDIGLQAYRHPIQTEIGGISGYYQPDGGSYFQGNGPQYDQFIVAPKPIMVAVAATELSRRIASGGADIVVDNYIAKMIADVKTKAARVRNGYLQGYNNGLLAVVDASYGGGGATTVPFVNTPFGGRNLNRGDQLQWVDANFNVVGITNVQSVQNKAVGGIDTAVFDTVPGAVAGGYGLIPIGLASGTPVAIQGLQYIVSPSAALEYCGVSRANDYVQAPAYNAGGSFLTLGVIEAFKARMFQSLGVKRFRSDRRRNMWYGHQVHQMSANLLGYSKTFYMANDGSTPKGYDIGTDMQESFRIGGQEVELDSEAAIDKLYWLDKSTLKRVRYPGSQKFIPGPIEGMFWPRMAGGLWLSESDMYYQDALDYYSNLPVANGVIYNLGIQPSLAVANS